MEKTTFHLLDECWIRVVRSDGKEGELSLRDVFLHAHEYADLSGELPAQDFAMLRFLLAVLHAVFSRVDETGVDAPLKKKEDAYQRWRALWELGHFPEKPILDYLERWRDRFDLFHPDFPFWQVPAVKEAKEAQEFKASKLNGEIAMSGNKSRIFCTRTGVEKNKLSFAEAARWLLYTNGFDDAGFGRPKSGTKSARKTKGWLGGLGLISAKGENLFETLLLNFVLLDYHKRPWELCQPVWEREEPGKGFWETVLPPRSDQAALLTWQSRRLLLCREGDSVTGFRRVAGDILDEKDMFAEQMTMWRLDKKEHGFCPKAHDRSRRMWQDFNSLMTKAGAENNKNETHTPGIVTWMRQLIDAECLPENGYLCLRIVSVSYDNKGSSVVDSFEDSLTFHRNLLSELGDEWMARIDSTLRGCEELADYIADLALHLHYAKAGKKGKKKGDTAKEETRIREQAKEQFYYRLDVPFRDWLRSLEPSQGEKRQMEWKDTARRIAEKLGRELVKQAGPVAFRGRYVEFDKEDGKSQKDSKAIYSAPKAYNSFKRKLNNW